MYEAKLGAQLKLFSEQEVQAIHNGVIRLLEEVGMQVKSKTAFEYFAQGGAIVDPVTENVKIPRAMLEKAIQTAPSKVTIHGREEKNDVVLEKNRVHFGTGGTVMYALDFETGKRRMTKVSDVRDLARLVDTLENISFYVIHTYPSDVPEEDVDANRF